MKQTTFQHPELRDANDNIIQQGTYGKESPLVNSTNDGVLDYINNNLEALHDNINGSRIYVANKAALPATGDLSAMYIAEDTGKWYLWDGSKYIETDNARKIADEAIAARDAAKASQTAAKTSETNAKTSETNAAASKTAAATSATNAANSASTAGTQANTAKAWATATTSPDGAADTSSTTGKTQSAKSWAMYSKDRATASASSASAAAGSAGAAKTSETNAASSKTAAATSATNAANSAKAAAASATAAANSAREQQADWAVTDTTSKAFVKNKPTVVTYEEGHYKETMEWESNCVQSIAEGRATDHPDAYDYGVQVTLGQIEGGTNGNARIYFPHNGGMYLKNFWGSGNTSGWLTMLHDKNYSKFALPKDGTAVKATSDAAGNNIQTTYAKKSDLASSLSTTSLTVSGATSVPTANAGNSSKAIANTEFVAKSISALVNGAPDQLNTLNELAKALGNDSNFAATITAELAKKLNSTEAESEYATKTEAGVPYQIKRNTAYKVDDVLTSPSLPPGCVIVVMQAGTTGSTEPDWTTIKSNIGGVISDGTVTFYINDTLSKHSIGDIVYKPLTKTGEHEYLLPLDGQTIDGTKYKRLVDYMGTATLPNLNGRYLRVDSTPGQMVAAGLPNITYAFDLRPASKSGLAVTWDTDNGAIKISDVVNDKSESVQLTDSTARPMKRVAFNASKANSIYGKSTTVTPPTYTVKAYICYA